MLRPGEGALGGDFTAEGVPRPAPSLVGVAPSVEGERTDASVAPERVANVDRRVAEPVVGGDVRVVVGRPAHAEAWQQGGGEPDRLGTSSSGRAGGHLGPASWATVTKPASFQSIPPTPSR